MSIGKLIARPIVEPMARQIANRIALKKKTCKLIHIWSHQFNVSRNVTSMNDIVVNVTTRWEITAVIDGFAFERIGGLIATVIGGSATAVIGGLPMIVIYLW